ncbi:hypothetical protein KK141_02580 [Dyella sp. LX-66]|uniref:hypothetical protein n=1 Tax=unclassified Dyella TaxID=2634549 RepID=UPI001BDFBDFE|nr:MULTISPECIES: hypothetical protein [unclassified Dyella]MBT2117354.1 hypothetical protein [Dyella sp. LX-1]MBT2138418.1 hypothetical protein [Dyella sp. LX-66]
MHYDQSWMGYGIVGGLEAGAISAVVAFLLYALFNWIGNRNDWAHGMRTGWSSMLALLLTASGDLWDMVYFNYGRVESIQFLKVKLAEVHDFDGVGTRVFFEFLGVAAGVFLSRLLFRRKHEDKDA